LDFDIGRNPEEKNRRRAREPRRPRSARRRPCSPQWPLSHPSTDSPAAQPRCTATQAKVIAGVPVDAIRREVEGIVAVVGGRSKPRARQLPLATTLSTIDVEAALMDEGDRLAKSSRDGGEKTFIIPK